MKCYKLWYNYEYDEGYASLISKEMFGINQYDLDNGNLIEKWPNFSFYFNPNDGILTDYCHNDLHWFIVSKELKDVIEKLQPEGVQFLPILIKNEKTDNIIDKNYWVVNVLNVLENVFDYENTIYVMEKPPLEKVAFDVPKFWALKEKNIGENNMFKIKEDTSPIFVSDKFRKLVRKRKLLGCNYWKAIMT